MPRGLELIALASLGHPWADSLRPLSDAPAAAPKWNDQPTKAYGAPGTARVVGDPPWLRMAVTSFQSILPALSWKYKLIKCWQKKIWLWFFSHQSPSNESSWHLLCYSGINPPISASLQRKSLVALGFICYEKRPSWGKNTSLLIPKNIKDKISGLLFSTHLSLPIIQKSTSPFPMGS